ncbi:putative ceramide glucosyltransferase [Schistosoma mansoni]|uniref:ceramide glucosyltransferase n=1 Tax=Schistosoma mansoni TaxID=6183 RepID=G4VJB9_SCHMA|nr:putative ceramide glucosyltransferase [Schistosoma mansoni]|eukprot:XP_018652124.1 putative ceramide glucosyltransferase [Schistosoma mansoni]
MFQVEELCSLGIFILSLLVLFLYFHQICFFLISLYTARCLFYPKRSVVLTDTPGVSVVKPLMGVDDCLHENLKSHFTLDYPRFELLFCVQNENDPVISLLQSLCEQYPHVNSRLFIGGKDGVVNPMVHNMVPAYEAAKYNLVWVSTSRVKASAEVIWDFVCKAHDPSVAIVHQLPFFADHSGFVAAIEKVTFGCYLARSYTALNQLGVTCFTGMSYIVKKSMLNEVGGLAYFGKYLAEDYFLSAALCQKGYRVVLSSYPVIQNVSNSTLINYIRRMVRWLRLRLNMLPLVSGVLEPLCESITLGLLFALTVHYLFDIQIIYLIMMHFTLWILLDYTLLRCIQNSKLPFSFAKFLLAWISRELLVYVVFITALSNPWRIKWGNYTYRIHFGGLTQRLSSNSTIINHYTSDYFMKINTDVASYNYKPAFCGTPIDVQKVFKRRTVSENIHMQDTNRVLKGFRDENRFDCLNDEITNNSQPETHLFSYTTMEVSPVIHDNKNDNSNDTRNISFQTNSGNVKDIVSNSVTDNFFPTNFINKTNVKLDGSNNETIQVNAHTDNYTNSLDYNNGINNNGVSSNIHGL